MRATLSHSKRRYRRRYGVSASAVLRKISYVFAAALIIRLFLSMNISSGILNLPDRLSGNEDFAATVLAFEFGSRANKNDDISDEVSFGENIPQPSKTPSIISYAEGLPYIENVKPYTENSKTFSPKITDVDGFDNSLLKIANATSYNIDPDLLLSQALDMDIDLSEDEPTVLVIHTHTSEAYTPTEKYTYVPSDPNRTENENYNMIRVGNVICEKFEEYGIKTVHDTTLYDYPTYTGSYTRSLEGINSALEQYPSIKIVLDVHRDAFTNPDGTQFGSVVDIDGRESAQIMFVVGSGEGGLSHPNWVENLKFALQLERQTEVCYPGLTRKLSLRTERFNQHATTGSLIIEVGCTGNTLEQALVASELFADSASQAILRISQQ